MESSPSAPSDDLRRRIVSGRRYATFGGTGLAIVLGYLVLFPDPEVGYLRAAMAATVVVVGAIPAFAYLVGGFQESLPLFALHGLFYSATFGLPAFSSKGAPNRPEEALVLAAVGLTLAGLLSLNMGYYVLGGAFWKRISPFRFPYPVARSSWVAMGWAFEILYLLWRALVRYSEASIPTVEQLVPALGWCGKGILFYEWLARKASPVTRVALLAVVLPFEIFDRLESGFLAQVLVLGLAWALMYLHVRRRLPVTVAAIGALTYMVLSPVKEEYRAKVWAGPMEEASLPEKVVFFLETGVAYYTDPRPFGRELPLDQLVARIDHVGTMAAIMRWTPASIPYAGGSTYAALLYSWVPRVLWEDKPRAGIANEWARNYGFLRATDYTTSYNLPWLPEFYMNFGPLGVLIGMAVVGIIMRLLAIKLCHSALGPVEMVLALPLVLSLWYAESNLALKWGNTLTMFLALYVVFRILAQPVRGPAPALRGNVALPRSDRLP